jgi:hypothetical protein
MWSYEGKWVSEWVSDCSLTPTLKWWWGPLSWICIVLAHWKNSPQIDMSHNSDILSWFRANQSLFFLVNAACLAEKQKYQFYNFWFDPIWDRIHDLPHSHEHANHYITDGSVLISLWQKQDYRTYYHLLPIILYLSSSCCCRLIIHPITIAFIIRDIK